MNDIVLELLDKNFDKQTEITTLINNLGICSGHVVKEGPPTKVIIVHPLVVEHFKNDLDSLTLLALHEQLLENFRYFNVKDPVSRADAKLEHYYTKDQILKAFLRLSDFIDSKVFRDKVSILLNKSKLVIWWESKRIKAMFLNEIFKRFGK